MLEQIKNLKNNISQAPAHLWVGDNATLLSDVNKYLQNIYCKFNGCNACVICKQIINKQHYLITWVEPENNYKTEDIEIIFEKISFSLDFDQKYYFILLKADTLTQSTAASLLKSIEEPPAGYNFILLAQRPDFIPQTIVSRCVVKNFSTAIDFSKHQLVEFFISDKLANIMLLNKALDLKPSEHESRDILDYLLKYWANKQKEAILNGDNIKSEKISKIINIFETALNSFQMPGSSKIFWRNIYLQYLAVN